MIEPYIFRDSTAGEPFAGSRSVSNCLGHPGYVQDQLKGLCEVLVRNSGVHELLGTNLAVSVGVDKKKKTLMFVIAAEG